MKSAHMIKKSLCSFYDFQQELLKDDELKKEWKVWLDSPAAYLTFAIAQFTPEEADKAAQIALRAVKDIKLMYVGALIRYWYANPTQEMLTLKQMYEKYGQMQNEEELSIAEGYAKETGYAYYE